MKKVLWPALILLTAVLIYLVASKSSVDTSTASTTETASTTSTDKQSTTQTKGAKRELTTQDATLYYDDEGTTYFNLPKQPFQVVQESDHFAWTAEDCLLVENMQQLANNQLRFDHFRYQNIYAERRQLVYLKEPFMEQGRDMISGKSREVTLPLLDGKQLTIEVDPDFIEIQSNNEIEGQIMGFLYEGEDMNVNGGYANGTWVFYVDQTDGTSYHVEERIPQELIVTQLDRETQSQIRESEHSHTSSRNPQAVGSPQE